MAIVWYVLIALLVLLVLGVCYGMYRTWKTGRMPEYEVFMKSAAPTTVAEGLWKGTADELGEVSWKGKKFLPDAQGINLFGEEKTEKYPFSFFPAPSLSDSAKTILRIDYGRKENPLWLRLIVDEMVRVADNKFLGAVYIDLIPGFPFRMGYFRLER